MTTQIAHLMHQMQSVFAIAMLSLPYVTKTAFQSIKSQHASKVDTNTSIKCTVTSFSSFVLSTYQALQRRNQVNELLTMFVQASCYVAVLLAEEGQGRHDVCVGGIGRVRLGRCKFAYRVPWSISLNPLNNNFFIGENRLPLIEIYWTKS